MSSKYTKDKLEKAVKTSKSWADVCRYFDVKPATGSQTYLTNLAKMLDINTEHFIGFAWNKGKTFDKKPIEFYLVKDGTFINNSVLRKRLVAEGLHKEECSECRNTKWRGQPIPLELDHINGDNQDRRLENLRSLCPNCHALTPTYCRRKPV